MGDAPNKTLRVCLRRSKSASAHPQGFQTRPAPVVRNHRLPNSKIRCADRQARTGAAGFVCDCRRFRTDGQPVNQRGCGARSASSGRGRLRQKNQLRGLADANRRSRFVCHCSRFPTDRRADLRNRGRRNTKPVPVVTEARVEPGTIRRARKVPVLVPRTAAQHAVLSGSGSLRIA